jgi:ribonuclease P/MRP protein subunit POP1
LRLQLGIPGSRLRAEVDDARLPLLLVQQTLSPEISSSPLASPPTSAMHGYLLFHPRGWSQPLLHSLVFTGTRIGGIREHEAQAFESGAGCWPRDFVGSEQGALWWNAKAKEDKFTWDRKPPAKRPNYLKHGWEAVDLTLTESRLPWKPDWPGVVAGYPVDARMADEEAAINDAASFAAQPFLLHLPAFSDVLVSLLQASEPAVVLLDAVNQHRSKRGLPALPPTAAPKLLEAAMVRVSVEMLARGVAGDVGPIFSLADDPVGLEEERLWRSSYGGGRKGRDVDHEAEVRQIFRFSYEAAPPI